MNGQADVEVDYKKKYRNLKRKLKFLIYEHECFQEELRKAQRKLLKVSRDKSFLLDRLLQYENVDEDSSDSDATASSENSETEGTPKLTETPAPKRKRSPPLGGAPSPSGLSLPPSSGFPLQASGGPSPYLTSMAVGPSECPVGGSLTFPGRGAGGAGVGATLAPLGPPKLPPHTILSTVPRQMFSDAGSGDDALDGDDDLVIDIPE
ncbi:INO80 complex subunit E [Petaurus breviceps papuanus]|uniref:INO80 complex subunit E n=1 Tax=Petaurus breviceps papuanus TaxID=3040969 RepID=UPI001CFDEB2C|nr:INO80 complex subunit E isoform X2 [Gracilinanus agilis]